MKSLAYIATFTLGAFAGGALMFYSFAGGLTLRTNNLVDDNAVVYEDEDIRVTRCNRARANDKVGIATIVYKNHC